MELAAAALLVLGRRRSGGALATLILAGAIAAHVTVLGVETPMTSAPDAAKSPMLFYMALGTCGQPSRNGGGHDGKTRSTRL